MAQNQTAHPLYLSATCACGANIAEDHPGIWLDAMDDEFCGDPDAGDDRTHAPE